MTAKVLIVDDQAEIRRLVRWTLEEEDLQLFEATNAQLGLQMARTMHPDVALLDWMMPGEMDGLALCQALRSSPDHARLRIVMLTARAGTADRNTALEAGAHAVLHKPFSPAKLVELIKQQLTESAPD
ncbi:response regulator [Pelomonas sp. CA6]|uniref:response regulator transcription factor n=1 Tax=Pelomonas sp. CA6 TaxID=2907999 RepID=UPI001F4B5AC6|nr:response regulator [Pelomonas sp. CA6]MCH7342486.1 response regulator [Pelomonas sp. CA6]